MSGPDIYWTGESGKKYGYWIHQIEARFRKIAGNFIFALKKETGEWDPVLIGQIDNFDRGFADKGQEACAREKGASHIHVHFSSPSESKRVEEADDLIAKWSPICNNRKGE